MTAPLLDVRALAAGYGATPVLFDISFQVAPGEVVTLLGRNGMGKTTTVKSVIGLVKPSGGAVAFEGADVTGAPPYRIAQHGIGLVPEGRQVFPTLSVEENLVATSANRFKAQDPWSLDRVYEFFPRLAERRRNTGKQLSGGEQQMLAIGRALMTNPKLLILDEATEGLAPIIREEIWACLGRLREAKQSIVVIDKNIDALARLADRHVIVEKGHVVWSGTTGELEAQPDLKDRYLSV